METAEVATTIIAQSRALKPVQGAVTTTAVGQKRKGRKKEYSSRARLVFIESEDNLDEGDQSCFDNKGIQGPDVDFISCRQHQPRAGSTAQRS